MSAGALYTGAMPFKAGLRRSPRRFYTKTMPAPPRRNAEDSGVVLPGGVPPPGNLFSYGVHKQGKLRLLLYRD
jgi:hypothetical protein